MQSFHNDPAAYPTRYNIGAARYRILHTQIYVPIGARTKKKTKKRKTKKRKTRRDERRKKGRKEERRNGREQDRKREKR